MIDYEEIEAEYEHTPTHGKMYANRDPQINNRMATLKRHEGTLNRYRKMGVIKA